MRKIVCMISLCLVLLSLTNCKGRGGNSDKVTISQTTTNGQSTEKAQAETKDQTLRFQSLHFLKTEIRYGIFRARKKEAIMLFPMV